MDRTLADKRALMRNTFRRNSSTEHGLECIPTNEMLTILNRMGQSVDERELNRYIDRVDKNHLGLLDFDGFTKVCNRFLRDPAALEKFKGDEFSFKHLITLHDFESP